MATAGLGNLMRACFKSRRIKKGFTVNLVQRPMPGKVLEVGGDDPVVLLHKYGLKVPSTNLHIHPETSQNSFFP